MRRTDSKVDPRADRVRVWCNRCSWVSPVSEPPRPDQITDPSRVFVLRSFPNANRPILELQAGLGATPGWNTPTQSRVCQLGFGDLELCGQSKPNTGPSAD